MRTIQAFAALLMLLAFPPPVLASDCGTVLASIADRTETNYAGFLLEVRPSVSRVAEYEAMKREIMARAEATPSSECFRSVRAFVDWFEDPHLFAIESPEYSPDALATFQREVSMADPQAARARALEGREPIEGVWFVDDREIAIVRDEADAGFVAIELKDSETGRREGEIVGRFLSAGQGYEATIFARDKSPRHFIAYVQKGVLLHMPPLTWGRRSPLSADQARLIDPSNPRAPTFALLNDRAALIGIPSFSPEHQEALEAIVTEHRSDIENRELLIVDLRGNEGGSSGLGEALAPFYRSDVMGPEPFHFLDSHILSSPDTIAYFEQVLEQSSGRYRELIVDLLPRLRAAPGVLVRMGGVEVPEPSEVEEPQPALALPAHVAVIVDEHVVSAGEAVLLDMKRSAKVTVFGHNTGGAIDYQSVNMVPIGEGETSFYLGYPIFAASKDLPAGAYNRTGVPVDVPLDLATQDPIAAVLDYYSAQ